MWQDEIVEEIHRIRQEYAESFNYDLDAIFKDLQKKEAESGIQVVNLAATCNLNTRVQSTQADTVDDRLLAINPKP
ncbi:MAG: hypothetical protein F6J92_30600 [Symploca sp. SIO1A3]|nr:hypothetical protein [Symploca sp. SIO1A3]